MKRGSLSFSLLGTLRTKCANELGEWREGKKLSQEPNLHQMESLNQKMQERMGIVEKDVKEVYQRTYKNDDKKKIYLSGRRLKTNALNKASSVPLTCP